MKAYDVYAISDWPETLGEVIMIWECKLFNSWEEAIQAGKAHYPDLEVNAELSQP